MRFHIRKNWLLVIPALAAGLLGAFFLLRGPMLDEAILRMKKKAKAKWDADLKVKNAHWEGMNRVVLPELLLKKERDTLLYAADVSLRMDLGKMMLGGVEVSEVDWREASGKVKLKGVPHRYAASGRLSPADKAWDLRLSVSADAEAGAVEGGPAFRDLNLSSHCKGLGKKIEVSTDEFGLLWPVLAADSLEFPKMEAKVDIIVSDSLTAKVRATSNSNSVSHSRTDFFISGAYAPLSHRLNLGLRNGSMPLQALLASLPRGLCPNLEGMEVEGEFAADFGISMTMGNSESLRFRQNVEHSALRVHRFGAADLSHLRRMMRTREVRPVADLPPHLMHALILSEDANFRSHRGFDTSIIRRAMIDNLEAGRFRRGAGTIPMQLVRNVFLSKEKQLGRKFEEVMLTWLMESGDYISKDEQLALYFEIIEWGPGIYGIHSASQFYFQKPATELDPDESLFLCAIVPNPRFYHTLLKPDGSLTDYAKEYWESMRLQLFMEDLIPEEDLDKPYPVFPKIPRPLVQV